MADLVNFKRSFPIFALIQNRLIRSTSNNGLENKNLPSVSENIGTNKFLMKV